ncbi:crotonobetainyl-CoA:carnitine CoA-transferase CaiB-like acyl-CoA transferase [Advenella incenata]|uniref:Crotonobetainyl-CoA:carnitine CoA-transferase CaiB-like acyl-CoA transferase n=1 Tax=Advenella incenata TaxID=267800 RepID=A0A4Q7VQ53_9BURK|nr:CaiB/BaiF CoA-transferase family protein [Advenella incenata]RZT98583.1 crotonobetainyl-CoA:carnitine CoA-transferase CaiB-like acyl-CoA transferase [Advenella incenata]
MTEKTLPYAGLKVIEFTHMVMGPTCGLILADLGADVIKIEPLKGDNTRHLLGSGAGFFSAFNRNKKSLAVDLKSEQGLALVKDLIGSADVVSENFKPGTMKKLGLDYDSLSERNPGLVYVSHKGFLPGPYEHRTALDEVVQMMGGLAYMTGRKGDPIRAGTSVNDIMGGMFGAIGVMAALKARELTGKGQQVQSALFENNIFLVAQHMMQYVVTGKAADPMPSRISAWAIYDVFNVKDGEQIFLAVVSDTQWRIFCNAFGLPELLNNPDLNTNNQRVQARPWLLPLLQERMAAYSKKELAALFEANALPFAPIARPEELLDDAHLLETGGLAPMQMPDGRQTTVPLLPICMDGQRLGVRLNPPRLGEHTLSILQSAGLSDAQINTLLENNVIATQ